MKKGMITIEPQLILRWLQFPFGELLHAEVDATGNLNLVISDSEMPDVEQGHIVPVVSPIFTTYQDCMCNKVAIRQPLKEI